MRATRAYVAGFGTAGSLVAGAAVLFVLASAVVSFRGWPQVDSQAVAPAIVLSRAPALQPSPATRRVALAAAGSGPHVGASGRRVAVSSAGVRPALGSPTQIATVPGHRLVAVVNPRVKPPSAAPVVPAPAKTPVSPSPTAGLGKVVQGTGGTVSGTVTGAGTGLGSAVTGATNALGSTVATASPALGQTVTALGQALGTTVTGATNALGGTVQGATQALGSLLGTHS